ncbi:hypothetical protein [Lacimicrobium sp. SS2-24]|uniref:hypothetical protein n=1 Tax=Lacimicrobium sp. SS2-24 TaxID=2005569 RepID=UPI000B4B9B60|nr:hypothetical protein [Lacimicrobium sp. SS2-24]
MQRIYKTSQRMVAGIAMGLAVASTSVYANGPIGEHVHQLQQHIPHYSEEVDMLIRQVDEVIATYADKGKQGVQSDVLIDYWEAVDFHAAIETSYVPVYALIWQGLFGVKDAIEKGKALQQVRQQQRLFETSLWQALGAVKLAAQYQQQGKLAQAGKENSPGTASQTITEINHRLDRVVAKAAEKLPQQAIDIVHSTYLNLFEGLEGQLIEQDASLVEGLEKDFNVTLPVALKEQADITIIRQIVTQMQTKLNQAQGLLNKAEKSTRDVF